MVIYYNPTGNLENARGKQKYADEGVSKGITPFGTKGIKNDEDDWQIIKDRKLKCQSARDTDKRRKESEWQRGDEEGPR